MHTSVLVLIILALVIVASVITSIITYFILAGRNKRIRLAEQYRQLGITEQYLKIQEDIERYIKSENIKLTTASPVKAPDFASANAADTEVGAKDLWFIVRGKDKNTSEKIFEYWHFVSDQSIWRCIQRQKKN
nr:hypothetical protein [uncultured Dorea sp.]